MTSRAVLVTGCSSRIGRATALRLVRAGWPVYATARRVASLDDLGAAGCRILALDVTDERSMADAVAAIEGDHGAVGVLVNNAGYSQSGAIESVPIELVRRQLETNVVGLVRLTQLVLPGMRRQRWGRVVNLGSMGGRLTLPGGGYYHATKYALEALSDALRFEVRGFGIGVTLVQPGLIVTGFAEAAVGSIAPPSARSDPYAGFNAAVARVTRDAYTPGRGMLLRLGGTPEDVAEAILRAVEARRTPARVPVTGSARLLMALRALLPDRAWDAFLRCTYPQPR